MTSTAVDPLVGQLLDGRYHVLRRLGRGGMATVYEATDTRLDRSVALKVMHADQAQDAGDVSRFIREARSAARLTHPNVVAVYDQGDDQDVVFLAMEFVPGRTLRDLLRERGRLSPREAFDLLEPVLAGLAAAHRAGLVHRDVKPENVLIGLDGRVKVADFGLVRPMAPVDPHDTLPGALRGTVAYLAPEVTTGGPVDSRADVYAVGILLYETLVGHPPFVGDDVQAVAQQHVDHDVPPPSQAVAGLPREVDDLVAAAAARDPADRPADADQLLRLLESTRDRLAPGELATVPVVGTNRRPSDTLVVSMAPGRAPGAVASPRPDPTLDRPVVIPAPAGAPRVPSARRRPVLVWLLVLLLLAGAVGAGAWYLAAGRTTVVPSVVSLTAEAATQKLQGVGLTARLGEAKFSETVPVGSVIGSDPPAGERARSGSAVTLVVSRGPERYAVPSLAGKTVDEAKAALAAVTLTLGEQTQAYSETVPAGEIVSSDPKAGVKVKPRLAVRVVVSKGIPPVAVPRVTGLTLEAASKALTDAKLKVTTGSEVFSETVPKGSVVSQSPEAGKSVKRGTTVTLVVSKGPPLVEVPRVVGKQVDKATEMLKKAGFRVEVNRILGGVFGTVRLQNPDGGALAPKGSTVTITIV